MFNSIEKYLKKSRSERILRLASKLIKECEQDFNESNRGVYNIAIWFDYDHIPIRDITVQIDDVEYRKKTNQKNKNYKNI